jgi:hypothetical protein
MTLFFMTNKKGETRQVSRAFYKRTIVANDLRGNMFRVETKYVNGIPAKTLVLLKKEDEKCQEKLEKLVLSKSSSV